MSKTYNRRNILRGGAATLAGSAALAAGSSLSSLAIAAGESKSKSENTSGEKPSKYGIEGYMAPEIELDYWIDGDGTLSEFSIKAAQGKWVFLKFFQNWCPGCHSSGFPTLQAVCDEFYGHEMVEIAAIQTVFEGYSTNTQEKVRELQLRYNIPAVMGHDPGDEESHIPAITMINYRTGGTPWLVLISPEGNVVFNNFHVNKTKLIEFLKEQIG